MLLVMFVYDQELREILFLFAFLFVRFKIAQASTLIERRCDVVAIRGVAGTTNGTANRR